MKAREVFDQNDGDVTKAYYAAMNAKGIDCQLGVALFRAQKRSTAAKRYRGRKYTQAAYDVKNWSMGEICRLAKLSGLRWGWKRDPATTAYEWVLYVDLPNGQVSFHSPLRLEGPDYPGEWDGIRGASVERILAFCDSSAGIKIEDTGEVYEQRNGNARATGS